MYGAEDLGTFSVPVTVCGRESESGCVAIKEEWSVGLAATGGGTAVVCFTAAGGSVRAGLYADGFVVRSTTGEGLFDVAFCGLIVLSTLLLSFAVSFGDACGFFAPAAGLAAVLRLLSAALRLFLAAFVVTVRAVAGGEASARLLFKTAVRVVGCGGAVRVVGVTVLRLLLDCWTVSLLAAALLCFCSVFLTD